MFESLRRWWALRRYCRKLPRLLRQRYGAQPSFKPGQVLTTIKKYRLSERYAQYACALFCWEKAYAAFCVQQRAAGVAPMQTEFAAMDLGDMFVTGWGSYSKLRSELAETFSQSSSAHHASGSESSFWADTHHGEGWDGPGHHGGADFDGHGHDSGHHGGDVGHGQR